MGDEDRASESTWKVDVQLRPAPCDRELQRRDQLVESGNASVRVPVLGSGILDLEGPIGRLKLPRRLSAIAHRLRSGFDWLHRRGNEFSHARDHLRAVKLDVFLHRIGRQARHAEFQIETVGAEDLEVGGDLLSDCLG